MFIEPGLSVTGAARQLCYPDLVICNTREVIGIIELKYQPRTKPSWQKDIATFKWLVENKSVLSISNSRFRGIDVDARTYPLSNDLLYVWAGVHTRSDVDLLAEAGHEFQSCFLALHAETSPGAAIRVF